MRDEAISSRNMAICFTLQGDMDSNELTEAFHTLFYFPFLKISGHPTDRFGGISVRKSQILGLKCDENLACSLGKCHLDLS